MDASEMHYEEWIGRREERHDVVTLERLQTFAATFDEDPLGIRDDDPVPPLFHWTLFLPLARQSELGEDGHARRGGLLPPVHSLPRRMWAGGRLTFNAALRAGMRVTRHSEVVAVKAREGSLGPLVFVTVRHKISEQGHSDALLVEEHDIVYRRAGGTAVKNVPRAPLPADWRKQIDPDDTLLFRYSALTFNGHRIHYDRRYATSVEGYPGLIVHGPLIATLLVDLLTTNQPEATLKTFSFRAVAPLFDGSPMFVNGMKPTADGKSLLWATNSDGGFAMEAEATII
jgi:3-methylfumaryl-CoA hydratase